VIFATAGGFIGVIWTDVFQGTLIVLAVLYMCFLGFTAPALPETFMVSVPNGSVDGKAVYTTMQHTAASWMQVAPPQTMNMVGDYEKYNDFWKVIGIFIMLTIIGGSSGSGGYMAQRYLAAKNEREAGLVSLFWTLLLSLRWPMVISFAILGIHYGVTSGTPIENPESVLSTVLATQLPVGVKGLIVACFLAAFMSTFSSFLNSTSAFWSNDLYKVFIRPQATGSQLVLQGRLATVLIVAVGLVTGFYISAINDLWGWISGVLGAGMAIPLLLRWYWWRFNGWGFAIGTAFGMGGAYLFPVITPGIFGRELAEHEMFLLNGSWTIVWSVLATLLTAPVAPEVLDNFYRKTRPFGFWKPVREALPAPERASIKRGNIMEILSGLVALPWQLTLFLLPMAIILKSWNQVGGLLAVLIVLSIALYFFWYRNLSKEA
jgi:Na+/proline symporter